MAGKVLVSRRGATAAEHSLASQAGCDAMRAGGNAFDAAVAASFALSVTLPHLNGLGGDFFALFYDSRGGKVWCLNGSGWAPSGLTIEALSSQGLNRVPMFGPSSAVVPGMVAGVAELHSRFGRTEFAPLLGRAVTLAEEGFPVSPGLARALSRFRGALPEDALLAFGAEGIRPTTGEALRQKALGERIREIADGGPEEFYHGEAGGEIAQALEAGGVVVDRDDLSFSAEWVEPLSMEYHGHRVSEVPPNSMGAATLMILKAIGQGEPPPPDSLQRVTRLTEATKLAMAAKDEHLGDPRFVGFDLDAFLNSNHSAEGSRVSEGDTTYFAVADEEGNLLSCIQSLFHPFGSRVYLKNSGFFLNNRACSFKFEGPNKLAPKKRPVHTLSALLLSKKDGDPPSIAMGTSGGELRPQLHALFVSNVVDYSMDIEAALAYPRFVWNGEETEVERGYKVGEGLSPDLRVVDYPSRQGVAQGIELTAKGKKAVCDFRGDGTPAGY